MVNYLACFVLNYILFILIILNGTIKNNSSKL